MEICSGCGASASFHPIVGIGKPPLGRIARLMGRSPTGGEMQAFPVCAACHLDPAHRTTPLKLHFFPASQHLVALSAARIVDERSKRGEDLNL